MTSSVRWAIVIGVTLASPVTGYAQEATVGGTVTDSTGGVLPGVTVTAVHEVSGNIFEDVTDARGTYRLLVRAGAYRLTVELPGFTTIVRSGLELLLGQQATVNLQMVPSALQESITVTAEAPLVDVTQSRPSGNVDPRQMEELPVNGRNWMDLSILATGARTNATNNSPLDRATGAVQINVDGQQVTQNLASGGSFGQPGYSRDAIAEFELVSNRFDATQGRSSGVQLNAITKSGTNLLSGSFSGYFRHDRFNAADFIQHRVLPYSNQQLSGTFGGPIRRDRVHFFGNYEYEREPQTFTYTSPYPSFNIDQSGRRTEHKGGVRLDVQFSPGTRLTVRGNKWAYWVPFDPARTGGATAHPSGSISIERGSDQYFGSLTQVLGNRAVNEIKAGYTYYMWQFESIVKPWSNHPQAAAGIVKGAPALRFRGYTIGQTQSNTPQTLEQDTLSIRDDFTYSYTKGGRHDLKVGGEFLRSFHQLLTCRSCVGVYDLQGGPPPANLEALFPVWNDVSTWNLAALSPLARSYTQGVGNFRFNVPRNIFAAWVQNDWAITPRLTLNLGLRYDLYTGAYAEWVEIPPLLKADRPNDTNNIAPRLGFAMSLNDRTVLRGGFGKYFAEISDQPAHGTVSWINIIQPEVVPDGRADFVGNPWNGPGPTYAQVARTTCPVAPGPSCLRPNLFSHLAGPTAQTPWSYQASIGLQRQLANTIAVEADYVYNGGRDELYSENINMSYNPATGANYPFSDISRRPQPAFGVVQPYFTGGRSNYHALQSAFTKRFSNRWQASATYLLSGLWDGTQVPHSWLEQVTFPLAPDLGRDYSLATTDQRHRAVFNGIWEVGYGFQLSGLYFFGSGQRFGTSYGGDLRNTGNTSSNRLRPNGTIVPRNNLVGEPIHRVDIRVQRRFGLGGRARVDGILETFNLFNHANYGSYTTAESNRRYGQPSQNTNVAYQPRMLQLGFRFTF